MLVAAGKATCRLMGAGAAYIQELDHIQGVLLGLMLVEQLQGPKKIPLDLQGRKHDILLDGFPQQ